MTAAVALRASSEERERLAEDFVRLCEIESPSRAERAVADFVTADALRRLKARDPDAAVVAYVNSTA